MKLSNCFFIQGIIKDIECKDKSFILKLNQTLDKNSPRIYEHWIFDTSPFLSWVEKNLGKRIVDETDYGIDEINQDLLEKIKNLVINKPIQIEGFISFDLKTKKFIPEETEVLIDLN